MCAAGVDEVFVHAYVGRELGVERRRQEIALAGGHHSAVVQGGQRFGLLAQALHHGRANEHCVQRLLQDEIRKRDV